MKRTFVLGFLLVLFFYGSFCYGSANIVEVVGFGECADCKENNIKASQALSGLKVTIDCKVEYGEFQTRGVGKLDDEGQFKLNLPQEILKDGTLSEECYVQLHNAANAPCAFHNGLEASKITFMSKSNEKHTFGPTGLLKFSSAICTSATLWPSFPKSHPWYKKFHNHFPHPPVVVKPEPKPKPKPEPKPKQEPKPKPGPKEEPKPKPEWKPKPKPKPKQEAKPQPKPKPKPKPEPFHKKPCPPFSLPKLPPLPTLLPKWKHHPLIPGPPHH
ncbi:hypothetical protein Hanom_Chr10g00915751 [Helianthus anomalus]